MHACERACLCEGEGEGEGEGESESEGEGEGEGEGEDECVCSEEGYSSGSTVVNSRAADGGTQHKSSRMGNAELASGNRPAADGARGLPGSGGGGAMAKDAFRSLGKGRESEAHEERGCVCDGGW